MKIKMATFYSKVLSFLLAILGLSFSACFSAEYGAPYAFIKVKGKVVDKESKEPIPGIGVVMNRYSTVYTDDSGVFNINRETFGGDETFTIKFQDVDGELNGEYLDEERIIQVKVPDYKAGDKDWYDSETIVDMEEIELTQKEENE